MRHFDYQIASEIILVPPRTSEYIQSSTNQNTSENIYRLIIEDYQKTSEEPLRYTVSHRGFSVILETLRSVQGQCMSEPPPRISELTGLKDFCI